MSRSLNKATLIGNVGSDPEVKSIANGSRVASFSLATGKQWNDQSGAKQEKTEWHKCVVWNGRQGSGLADVVERYVKRGSQIYVEGEIQYRQYTDKEGQTRYVTEINVKELLLLGGRGGAGGSDEDNGARRSASPAKAVRPAAAAANSGGDDFTDFPGALEDDDDDLPF